MVEVLTAERSVLVKLVTVTVTEDPNLVCVDTNTCLGAEQKYYPTVTLICRASCTVAPGLTMDSSSWMILLRLSTRVSRLGAGLGAAISCSQLHNTGL